MEKEKINMIDMHVMRKELFKLYEYFATRGLTIFETILLCSRYSHHQEIELARAMVDGHGNINIEELQSYLGDEYEEVDD